MRYHAVQPPSTTTVLPDHSAKLAELLTGRGYACTYVPVKGVAHSTSVVNGHQLEIIDFFDAAVR